MANRAIPTARVTLTKEESEKILKEIRQMDKMDRAARRNNWLGNEVLA